MTVGDEWSGEITTGNAGMSVTLDVDYTLVALDDESYTVDFEYETDVDEAGVTGTTSASGTITTNRGNPLLVDGDTVSTTELDSGGMTLVQGLDLVMTSESIED